MKKISRREFLKGSILTTTALLFFNPFKLIASSRSKNWTMPEGGRISYKSGSIFINGNPADIGDEVKRGDTIKTGSNSEADVEIRDFAIFHIKENTEILMDQIIGKTKLMVKKGWFLTIVKRGTPFNVATPMVLAGVRGTVFFFNVLDNDNLYICDCNGVVDITNVETGEKIKKITSYYHTAYNISRRQGNIEYNRASLKYHGDKDILRIAERFPAETSVFKEKQRKKGSINQGSGY